jgi:N-methylhydantoinase B
MSQPSDPIAFELFKNAMFSIADEMALTICRTTYSGVLRDNMDFSTAFADADGKLVAQGLTLPGHLGSIPTALEVIVERFAGDIAPEDIFIMNDPFDGGMHLPDIFIFKPIFAGDERLAFAATICHHCDVGGRVPGSNASDSTEIYQEGLRIPPLKLYDRGKRNATLFQLIERNVRLPVQLFGDLRAQLAACHIAEKQFLELNARYGTATVQNYMQEIIDYAERLTRAAVSELPDGVFSFEDWIDDDGIDVGQPIRLFVTLKKHGDRMLVDWTGSSDQVKGAINNTLSYTKAASYTAIRSILPPGIPNNEGVFRVIDVTAPAGTIANAVLPAACAARGLTGFRMVDCCFGALAQMLPDKVYAASDGGNTGITIGGYDANRKPFIYVDFTCGTWGARPWADGLDGNSNMFANMASQPVEITEAEQPLQILAYEFISDKAGAGKYRGGTPYRRDYRFLEKEAILQVRADRQRFRPYGLYGGQPGKPSLNVLNPDTENRVLPGKLTMNIKYGDVFRHEVAGAGGWGDPLERDPDKVLKDVRNEFISADSARAEYGVVVDTETWTVDEAATARLRNAMAMNCEHLENSAGE